MSQRSLIPVWGGGTTPDPFMVGWFVNMGAAPSQSDKLVEIETMGGTRYENRADAFRWSTTGSASDIRKWQYVDAASDSKIMSPTKKMKIPKLPLPVFDTRPLPSGDKIMDIVDSMSKGRGAT